MFLGPRPVSTTSVPLLPPPPLVKENATVKLSDHVYVIPDGNVGGVPNVGIIVGATEWNWDRDQGRKVYDYYKVPPYWM